jgi:hypothetical protein
MRISLLQLTPPSSLRGAKGDVAIHRLLRQGFALPRNDGRGINEREFNDL